MDPAASCRSLARRVRFGSLATLAQNPAGWPFATLVAVAFDPTGRPLLVLSRLAEHTKNLEACEWTSLLVAEEAADDPLSVGRMTLLGSCGRVPEDERNAALSTFLGVHPEATGYAEFPDFTVWRMEVAHVRWIGGF